MISKDVSFCPSAPGVHQLAFAVACRRLTLRLLEDCDLDEPDEVRGVVFDTGLEAIWGACWLDVWSMVGWRR